MALRSSQQGFRSGPGMSAHREFMPDEFGFQTQREKVPGQLNMESAVGRVGRTIIERVNSEGKRKREFPAPGPCLGVLRVQILPGTIIASLSGTGSGASAARGMHGRESET